MTREVTQKEALRNLRPAVEEKAEVHETDIAIIGGGIAGLYCGYRLSQLQMENQKQFRIFEESTHLGGRIWSTRIPVKGENAKDDGSFGPRNGLPQEAITKEQEEAGQKDLDNLEFCAEFGPMRIELDLQHRLSQLLKDLGLSNDLERFPAYKSPTSEHDPKYELVGEERDQETPLDLLQLAVARIVGRLISRYTANDLRFQPDKDGKVPRPPAPNEVVDRIGHLEKQLERGVQALSRAVATRQQDWKSFFKDWIQSLDEYDYQNLREFGAIDDGTKFANDSKQGTALWNTGFWNVLTEVLSHHAVMKIRDLGTFYHLIPENPNAAEWLVFWLRNFRTSEQLVGIRGGMQRITEAMSRTIDPEGQENRIVKNMKLVKIESEGERLKLRFKKGTGDEYEEWRAKHVVLALPRGPLEELAKNSPEAFGAEVLKDIRGSFGFPLLKFFLVVRKRWWNEDATRTNRYATLIPTRELHYRASGVSSSSKGMILVYTDRPASTFWSNYIQNPSFGEPNQAAAQSEEVIFTGIQDKPEEGGFKDNPGLIRKALQYLRAYGVGLDRADIEYYGIRDWGREPYLGAAHAWYPERQSWRILKRLSAFAPGAVYPEPDSGKQVLHVCGEAYSDYQAFIEGSLRSAAHILHTIDRGLFKDTPTPWLCESEKCSYEDNKEEEKRLRGEEKKACANNKLPAHT
jgi:hypothetical protein